MNWIEIDVPCDYCGHRTLKCTSRFQADICMSKKLPTPEEITRDVIAAQPELDRRSDPVDTTVCHNFHTPRAKLLDEVMEIVHKDRNANYGSPENNFQQIADLWNGWLNARMANGDWNSKTFQFSQHDVAIMNMLIKVARLAKNPNHHDSAVDIAGYAACLADVQASSSQTGKN